MKTSAKMMTAMFMSGVFAVATYAAPPSKSTAPRTAKPALSETSKRPENACTTMRSLTSGGAKGSRTIQCTPELMKTDARCRAMCQVTAGG